MAEGCSCGVLDLAKGSEWSEKLDGLTTHFFDGTPCRVVPCSPEEPCKAVNDVHVQMFGGCWVMRSVFHGGDGQHGRVVDPEIEQRAREEYEMDLADGDVPWSVLTEQGRQMYRQMVARRGA